jgi:hypothetical protein
MMFPCYVMSANNNPAGMIFRPKDTRHLRI